MPKLMRESKNKRAEFTKGDAKFTMEFQGPERAYRSASVTTTETRMEPLIEHTRKHALRPSKPRATKEDKS
jgi:hypothetical protein